MERIEALRVKYDELSHHYHSYKDKPSTNNNIDQDDNAGGGGAKIPFAYGAVLSELENVPVSSDHKRPLFGHIHNNNIMSRDAFSVSSCEMSSDLRTNLRYSVAQQVLDTKTPAKTRHKHDSFINGLTVADNVTRNVVCPPTCEFRRQEHSIYRPSGPPTRLKGACAQEGYTSL
eukprot:scaffold17789_cov34-Attheya_sp.AAC.3